MRMAVRMALAGLGLLATGVNVRGQTPGTPPAASPNPQKDQDANEITAVPNRPTFASTAEMVQFGVFEIEYGLEAAKGHQNINGLLKWGAVKNLELWFLHNPIERDAGTAGLGDSGAGFKYKLFPQMKARPTAARGRGAAGQRRPRRVPAARCPASGDGGRGCEQGGAGGTATQPRERGAPATGPA